MTLNSRYFYLVIVTLITFVGTVSAQLRLGSLNADGTLEQEFVLGKLHSSPEFSMTLTLRHRVPIDVPASLYEIPQLECYLMPKGQEHWEWKPFGRASQLIGISQLQKELPVRWEHPVYLIEQEGDQKHDFDVCTIDGWVHSYNKGVIVSITAPTGRALHFETDGSSITKIVQHADEQAFELLTVRYNDLGDLVELSTGARRHQFEYDQETGQLQRWRPLDGDDAFIRFDYEKDLIRKITFPDGNELNYRWISRLDGKPSERGFKLPTEGPGVFLASDDHYDYDYGIDRDGLNLFRTDRLGATEGLTYNPRTERLVTRHPDGAETEQIYNLEGPGKGQLSQIRGPDGAELVKLSYDESGRIIWRKEQGMAPFSYRYDDRGRLVEVLRLNEPWKKYSYEGGHHQPSEIENALGDREFFLYDKAGRVIWRKDLEGGEHAFEFNDGRQLMRRSYPSGDKEVFDYDDFGKLVGRRFHWSHGEIERIKYDPYGRPIESEGREGKRLQAHYDSNNRLVEVQKDQENWNYEFDESASSSSILKNGENWQQVHQENLVDGGKWTQRLEASGRQQILELDAKGNVKREINALGDETTYSHDAKGQLTGWVDPRGDVANFERDAAGRVVGLENADGKMLELQYDSMGRLRHRITPEQNINYSYDKEGRLEKIDYGKGEIITYRYDELGRLVFAKTSQGVVTTYTWDALDRKTSERNDLPFDGAFTLVKWTYTPSGRKESIALYKNGVDEEHRLQFTEYQYDLLGRYTAIHVDGKRMIDYAYDPHSRRLSEKRFFDGTVVKYEWTDEGLPQYLGAKDEGGKRIVEESYEWNDQGQLVRKTRDGILHEYEYDKLNRLTAVKKSLNGVIDLSGEWKGAREGVDEEGVPISIFQASFEHEFPDVPLVLLDLRSEHQGSPDFRIELGKIDPKGFELHAYRSDLGGGGREGAETELRVAWSAHLPFHETE